MIFVYGLQLFRYLRALARAYNSTYQSQEHSDFWGLREFYSTVRAINSSLARIRDDVSSDAASSTVALDSEMLLWAVLRNYGGRPNEVRFIFLRFHFLIGSVFSYINSAGC